MDYCWSIDRYAVLHQWEGKDNRLIVFAVPDAMRKHHSAINYFSIWAVQDSSDLSLKCEVIFPSSAQERRQLMATHDPEKRLSISSIDQPTGYFKPEDFDYLVKLIPVSRQQRLIT